LAYLVTISAYLVFLFAFGLKFVHRLKKKEDFLVAGRSLTAPVLVGTLLATWIGSGDVFSVSDLSYNHGYSSLIGSSGGWLGIVIVFFIAGRVRRFGQFTVPDILEARYNKWARIQGRWCDYNLGSRQQDSGTSALGGAGRLSGSYLFIGSSHRGESLHGQTCQRKMAAFFHLGGTP